MKSIYLTTSVALLLVVVAITPSMADVYSKEFPGKGSKQAFESSKEMVRKGMELAKSGKLAEAELEYRKAIATYPHFAITHFDLGKALYEQKKVAEAEAEMQTAVQLEPKLYDGWYSLGVVYEDLKKLDKAESSYRKAISIKPDYFDSMFNLALLLKGNGKLDESETLFKSAASLNVPQSDKDDVAKELKKIAAQRKK